MSKQDNKSYLMLPEVTIQRLEHLKLQGFTPEQASKMQKVSIWEVLKAYNPDKIFSDEKYTKVMVESVKKNN